MNPCINDTNASGTMPIAALQSQRTRNTQTTITLYSLSLPPEKNPTHITQSHTTTIIMQMHAAVAMEVYRSGGHKYTTLAVNVELIVLDGRTDGQQRKGARASVSLSLGIEFVCAQMLILRIKPVAKVCSVL